MYMKADERKTSSISPAFDLVTCKATWLWQWIQDSILDQRHSILGQ